jgi:hypothetical protein
MSAKAKRVKILDMLDGYSNLIGKDLTGLTNALAREAEPYPLDVVIAATQALARTCSFPPTTADMHGACERYSAALHPKVTELYNGLLEMDWGHGKVDMRGLLVSEQDEIIKNHGMIGGKNAAMMSLEQKREAIRNPAITAGKTRPRIQRMSDK